MRKLLVILSLLVLCALLPGSTRANEAWHDWCWNGNTQVNTSGLNSNTLVQGSSPQCIVSVFVHGGGVATIYADNSNTPLANPFVAQTNGQFIWYAATGRYDQTITTVINGVTRTVTMSDILLCDPLVPGTACAGGGGGTTVPHNLLSSTHLDTIPFSPPVQGDIITAQNQTSPSSVNPSWARLALGSNLQYLQSNGTDDVWAYSVGFYSGGSFVSTRSQLNVIAGTNVTTTLVDNPGSNRVDLTITASGGGGGGGCSLPGNNTGVLSEHPAGSCYNSAHWTWDDGTNKQNMQAGVSNTVGTQDTFSFGNTNNLSAVVIGGAAIGDNNTLVAPSPSSGVYALGQFNTVKTFGVSNGAVAIGFNNIVGNGTATLSDGYAFGESHSIYNAQQVTALNYLNCIGKSGAAGSEQYGVVAGYNNDANGCGSSPGTGTLQFFGIYGDLNGINAAHAGSSGTASPVYIVGYTNEVDTDLAAVGGAYIYGLDNRIDGANGADVVIVGSSNTANSTLNTSTLGSSDNFIGGMLNTVTSSGNFAVVGGANTMSGCTVSMQVGFNLSACANNSVAVGYGQASLVANANGSSGSYIITNASPTGTTTSTLTKLTTANPSTAIIATTSDTSGIQGITVAGAGTTGSAVIANFGIVPCVFDAGTTAGDYVIESTTSNGNCHDFGSTAPTSSQIVGRVLSTNGGAGTYNILLFPPPSGSSGISFADVKYVPAANCNNTTAGNGWSIGSGGTVTCRAGTNNKGGYVSITDTSTTFAQFNIAIPKDWNSSSNPYIRFDFGYPGTDTGHTIIPAIQVSCGKGDGTTTDDVSFNASHSSSTTTTNATANQYWSNSNVQMNSTDMTGCVAGSLMVIQVGRATDTATSAVNFYGATVTFPRLVVVQAN